MLMKRFTQLTNAFSKRIGYLDAAISLHFFHHNFMRIHPTLGVTPEMEAKLTNRLWWWQDLLDFGMKQKAT